ncbi:MAG: ACP S-malonyltransferase [Firmicutes bacterium]|nr:ACP S-malonyltransferase [Bacillota bacterium]
MIAFVFPGQGTQYVGMARDIHDGSGEAKAVFDEASDSLGRDMAHLCFSGPESELTLTANAQPAILTASVAILRALAPAGLAPAAVAGLSLGEYSALVAAGAVSFPDAIRLVRARGTYMQEAVPEGGGTMAAIIGLDEPAVRDLCREALAIGIVEVANLNSPGQVSVSGHVPAVLKVMSLAKSRGGSAVHLKVSAPFHCSLMKPAADRLLPHLESVEITRPSIPVYANVTAQPVENPSGIRELLYRQVYSPVQWEASIRAMIAAGARAFVEVGPGKTLTSMIRKIDHSVSVFSVQDRASFDGVMAWKEAATVGA